MTHLRIELNNGVTELVDSAVIKKLYDLAVSGLDSTSNLKGRLHALKAYGSHITYLTQRYPELYITAENRYVDFADAEVFRVLLTKYGDGVGITENDLKNITSIEKDDTSMFTDNTLIQTFDELSQTNVTELPDIAFSGCSNLRSVDTSRITKLKGSRTFLNSGLVTIDLRNLTHVAGSSSGQYLDKFRGPSSRHNRLFKNCANLKKVMLGDCSELGNTWSNNSSQDRLHFYNCPVLETIDVASLDYVATNGKTFQNCPSMKNFIIRSSTVPQIAANNTNNARMSDFGGDNVKIYVPDSAVLDYKSAAIMTDIAQNIYPLSEYVES